MGTDKAALPWGGTTLVARVAAVVRDAVAGPVVVVGSPARELPSLPRELEVVVDAHADRGPLEGLAAGLRALEGRAGHAYVAATDTPFLQAAFVRCVLDALGDGFDAAVPRAYGRVHPLAAAYRVSVLATVERLLAAERLRTAGLLDELRVRWLDEDELPELGSLRNVNSPEDLARARESLP